MTATIAGRRAASFAIGAAVRSVALTAMLLSGCAGGLVGPLPTVKRPAEASTVSVFRPLQFAGFIGPIILSIDGCRTLRVWGNQEYSFQLDPGQYILDYTIGFNECRRVAFIEPRRNYRFRLTPNCDRFNDGCGTGLVTDQPGMSAGGTGTSGSSGRPQCGGFDTGCD